MSFKRMLLIAAVAFVLAFVAATFFGGPKPWANSNWQTAP